MAFHAGELGLDRARRAGRRRRQRRQRGPRRLPRATSRRRSRRSAERCRCPQLGVSAPPYPPDSARSSARRSASRRSRIRIWASSTSARRSDRASSRASARIQPATTSQDRGQEDQVAGEPHDPGGQALVVERGQPPRQDERRVVRIEHAGRVEDHDRQERVLGHLGEQVADPRRMAHPPRRRDRGRPPATRTGARRSGTGRARGRGRSGPRATR